MDDRTVTVHIHREDLLNLLVYLDAQLQQSGDEDSFLLPFAIVALISAYLDKMEELAGKAAKELAKRAGEPVETDLAF